MLILFKIEIPSAIPTLLVGLNQCIVLSLAMVVLAGLVGAEVTRGLTRMGLGLRAGLSIVAHRHLSRQAFHGRSPAGTEGPRKPTETAEEALCAVVSFASTLTHAAIRSAWPR
jgi:glycine betaine/proline transport system permease protein